MKNDNISKQMAEATTSLETLATQAGLKNEVPVDKPVFVQTEAHVGSESKDTVVTA